MNDILRYTFLVYFITHIPITICVDLQAIFGRYYPGQLQNLFSWYLNTFNDQVMKFQPIWLKSFIFAELLLQLPFFIFAIYGLIYKKKILRIPSIVYGSHTATTLIPILSEILFSDILNFKEKAILTSFYLPYFILPVIIAIYFSLNPDPFKESKERSKTK